MVMLIQFIALFLIVSHPLLGDDVKVEATINPYTQNENQPMDVSVSITHPSTLKVDPNSFVSEGKPLKVEFVRDVVISKRPDLMISFFHFEKPGLEKGLYVLPSIGVTVNGKTYFSQPSTFEITGPDQVKNPPTTTPSPTVPTPPTKPVPQKTSAISSTKLRLEAFVDGKTTLYPHQKIKAGYRYFYSANIELTDENIPLLEGKGMVKVGDKDIQDSQQDKFAVRQVTQTLEAADPGTYTYGPSSIEGYLYRENSLGQRSYQQPKIKAEAPPIKITVLAFPTEGKPASFNGAVGRFTFTANLTSSPTVAVGDKVQITMAITGTGDLESVAPPDLCCQPGFSGRFKPSDLPATGTIQGNKKTFVVEITPLLDAITEIPSIEFSFFDPDAKKYSALNSSPIPLKVTAAPQKPMQEQTKSIPTQSWPQEQTQPAPIEIFGNESLQSNDLQNLTFGNWSALYIIPMGIILLMLQAYLKSEQQKRASETQKTTPQDILNQAINEKDNPSLFYHNIQKALLTHLQDLKLIPSLDIPAQKLPEEGLAGRIRAFLLEVEHNRYSSSTEAQSMDEITARTEQFLKETQ